MDEQRLVELKTMPYEEYLQTPEWIERRALAIQRAGNRCQVCNSGEDLNVHHRTYERRGNEESGDLTVLCQSCHGWFHHHMMKQEGLSHISVSMQGVLEQLEAPEKYRVPTGFADIDYLIGQLQKGQFIAVGSRTGQGGLPFILNIGFHAALAEKSVAFFSSTMNKDRIVEQLLGIDAGIATHSIHTSKLEDDDLERFIYAMGTLQEMSFWISDTAFTVEDIERQVQKIITENGVLDLIIIDSIELLENGKKDYPDQRTYVVSRTLKLLARKFHIPVIALCQIPSVNQGRDGRVPRLADVKNAEPFADIVMLLYFDQFYNPETERRNLLDVLIVKNSNGPVGEVSLFYDDSHSRVHNIEPVISEGLNQ